VARRNADYADLIDELGDLYELDGAVVYRVLAYRKAAARIRQTPEPVDRLAEQGRLTALPDIGDTIAAKIRELDETGRIAALDRLRDRYPQGLVEIMRLPGVGAKTTRKLFDQLAITSISELRDACRRDVIRDVPGLGPKLQERIAQAIDTGQTQRKQVILLDRASERAEAFLTLLRGSPQCAAASEAGSLRRRRDTVGDIDLIAASDDPAALIGVFCAAPLVSEVTAQGDTKGSVITNDGIQIDLRVVDPAVYGNLLQHFTGSKHHNVALREHAAARGLSVSEWGIENTDTGEVFRTADEDAVYEFLGYQPIPPELREDTGELDAARRGALPTLVTLGDIRGDLHTHTVASDGKDSIEAMTAAAAARGYRYLAITDHSAGVGMGIGLDADAIRRHADAIRRHAATVATSGLVLLAGVEVDVMADAALFYDDETLASLDWVVASLHQAQRQTRAQLTRRLVAAASHPMVDVIGHPTGRMLGRRDAYDVDLQAVIDACVEHGTFLEVNANPRRLDLSGPHVRLAVDAGVGIVISTDAHSTTTLDLMRYGVDTARRGWATPAAIINTRDYAAFSAARKPGRGGG
jgi:DNA polymerase (family X)